MNIKSLIQDYYQILDIPSYEEYKEEKFSSGITEREIEILSPDNISSADFWNWAASSPFAKDAICYGGEEFSKDFCNYNNYVVAARTGCLNSIFERFFIANKTAVLEIGPGFGFLKNFCEDRKFNYTGVDVHPLIPGVYKIEDGDTKLPDAILAKKYDIIVATNVFQHLSLRQRHSYYRQVAKCLLEKHGTFTFNIPFANGKNGFSCNGKKYICHYGQYTPLQTINEYIEDVTKYFSITNINQNVASIVTFTCATKD